MDRILAGSGGTHTITLYNDAGAPTDAGSGAGTAHVYDGADVEISGSPFTPAHTPGSGIYTITLPTSLTKLDTYRAAWTFPDTSTRETFLEVVGAFLFTIADVRAFDTALASKTAAEITDVREVIEERFEAAGGVSFTRRGRRVTVDGSGTERLLVPVLELAEVVEGSIDGTALTAGELADVSVYPFGLLVRGTGAWATGNRNVELLVEHGFERPPAPVWRAGLQYARHLLTTRPLETDRATAAFTDIGGYRLTIAGRDGPTGLPEVDAVLAEFGRMGAGSFA